jgi:tripartite-type tricarboxylate transporter receptor subunit TctC
MGVEYRRFGAWLLGCAFAVLATAPLSAQTYPTRPVKIISQAGVGSAPDVMARIMADELGKAWGQQPVIINRPGASGSLAAQMATTAEKDGYTLFLANSSTFNIMPHTQPNTPFDLKRDFIPVGFVAEQPMLIAVTSDLPVKTLPELIALAKQKPKELLYAGNAGGSLPNMTGEFFRERAGIDITFVSYPGAAAGLVDVAAGRVHIIVEGLPALFGAIDSKKIRPLAVAYDKRLPNLPDVPTVAETLPGFLATGWSALMALTGTSPAIVKKISADMRKGLDQPEVRAKYAKIGAYVRPMMPDELAAYIRQQQELWRPIVVKVLAEKRRK